MIEKKDLIEKLINEATQIYYNEEITKHILIDIIILILNEKIKTLFDISNYIENIKNN